MNRLRMPVFVILALIGLACSSGIIIAAEPGVQGPVGAEEAARPGFSGDVSVTVVNLSVTVLDQKGRLVHGLGPGAFEVFEDKVPREITNFEEVQGVQAKVLGAREGEQEDFVQQPAFLAIAFDHLSLEHQIRNRWIKAWAEQYRTKTPDGVNIMVAVLGDRPQILAPFTEEPRRVLHAIERVEEIESSGAQVAQRRRSLKREILRTGQINALLVNIDIQREQERFRILQTIASTVDLARSLAGLPGRKDLLLVTQNIVMTPALDAYEIFYKRFGGLDSDFDPPGMWASRHWLRTELTSVADVLHEAGVRLHVVDLSDRDRQTETADDNGRASDSWLIGQGMDEGGQYLAGVTGGMAFGNSRNYGRFFELLLPQVTDYYSLGYIRPDGADGALHDIEVKTVDKGYSLRYQAKVLAETTAQRLQRLTSTSPVLWTDRPQSPLDLDVFYSDRLSESEALVTLSLSFPTDDILFLERDGGRGAQIVVGVQTFSDGGTIEKFALARDWLTETDEGKLTVMLQLKVNTATSALVAAVRDEVGDFEAVATVDLQIGSTTGDDR